MFWAVMLSRAALLVVLVAVALAIAAPLRAPLSRLPLLAVPGRAAVRGHARYSAATREGDLSVVSVLGSLFPLVTVGLAFAGGERVTGQQAAGSPPRCRGSCSSRCTLRAGTAPFRDCPCSVQAETDSIDRKGNMSRRRIHGGTGIATVLITARPARPGGGDGSAGEARRRHRPGRQRRADHRHAHGRVNPNERRRRTLRVRHHAPRRRAGPEPARGRRQGQQPRRGHRRHRRPRAATTYHYRLVARNELGVTRGRGPHVPTQRQPLGLSLAATPNPSPGRAHADRGSASGTGNAERQIVLQSNPFPYTQGFQNASDIHLTNGDGASRSRSSRCC